MDLMNLAETRFGRRARHCLLAVITVLFAGLGTDQGTLAQARQSITGTSVSLVPLKGFSAASGFAGLQNRSTKASVMIVEMPAAAHPQLAALFGNMETAKAGFAKQNITVSGIDEVDTAAGKAPVINGRQDAGGMHFDKWIALFKGPKTVMVTVQSPPAAGLDHRQVLAMLASVTLGGEPSMADKLKALPFAISPVAPFRVVDTIGGSGVLMTVGPLNADPAGSQPLLIAVYQLSAPAGGAGKLEDMAEALLKQTRGFGSATIATRGKLRFAGRDGIMLTGSYLDEGRGPKRFAQYMAIGAQGRFIRLIASADEAGFDGLAPAIKAIARSVAFGPGQ
jgi:hypothetical protein